MHNITYGIGDSIKKIAVLGRGSSVKKYKKYSHLFNKVYVTGRFYKEIKKIGIEHFKGKEIIHVVCRGTVPFRNNYYNILNIKSVQTSCHSIKKQFCKADGKQHSNKYPKDMEIKPVPNCMVKRGYPPLSCNTIERYCNKFDNYKNLCDYLEEEFSEEIKKYSKESRRTRYWPTSGVYSLDLALNENKINSIHLFGIDLYTTVSYVMYKSIGEEFSTPIDTGRSRLGIYHVSQLVREFPLIKFYSASKSKKFRFNYSNWYLI
jgi:hypothetical protein